MRRLRINVIRTIVATCKRRIAVDTLGRIRSVVVHGASWQDHDGACFVLMRLRQLSRLKVVFADSAYGRCDLPGWVKEIFGWILQTVLRPVKAQGFVVLTKRRIVARTLAWISRCRRNSKDYERTTATSETMIYVTMIGPHVTKAASTKNNMKTRSVG